MDRADGGGFHIAGHDPDEVMEQRLEASPMEHTGVEFAERLVHGVIAYQEQMDRLIARFAWVGYLGGMELLAEHGITESKYDDHDQFDAFKRARFTDAQVKLAVQKFDFLQGIPARQVKEYLGLKVLNAKDGYDFAIDFLKQIGHGAA